MPAKSQKQRNMIFARRNQYGSKKNTPKNWEWIWDEGFENKGKLPKKAKKKLVKEYLNEDWYPMEQDDFDVWWTNNKDSDILKDDYEEYKFELKQMGLWKEEGLDFETWAREEIYNHL
jgi:hypothetical protein